MRLCIIIAIISITLILLGNILLPLIPLLTFYPTYEGIKYNNLYQNGAEIQYIGMTTLCYSLPKYYELIFTSYLKGFIFNECLHINGMGRS